MSDERQTCDRMVVAGMIVVLGPFVAAMSFFGIALAVKAWELMVAVVRGGV